MGLLARFPLPVSLGGPTPPSISNWQWQYNGLTMGASTNFGILGVTGLDLADVRQGDQNFPRDFGQSIGLDVYGGRDVSLDIWLTGTGGLVANQLLLSQAMTLGLATEQPLWFQIPTLGLVCVMARTRKRQMKWDADYAGGAAAKPTAQFHCTDPRIYAAGQSVTITLSSSGGGGITFPVGPFPVTFGASSPVSPTTVANTGTMESRPIVIFNGPVTNPWIGNYSLANNPYVQFENPAQTGYTVLAGDQLVVDLGTPHRVLYYPGGIASGATPNSAMSWLTYQSTWWNLPPGNNSIRYGSQDSSTTGLGTAVVVWSSAWQL